MPEPNFGGFEYRGRGYRFHSATFRFHERGEVSIDAVGPRCGVELVCVPFPGAATPTALAGQTWEPDDDELACHADVFADGGVSVRDKPLWVVGCRLTCLRYDGVRSVLVFQFRLDVQDDEDGREDELDGLAYCTLEVPDEDD